jgi:hypothetical protein
MDSNRKQAKVFIQGPSANKAKDLLKLYRNHLMGGRSAHRALSSKIPPFQTGTGKQSEV